MSEKPKEELIKNQKEIKQNIVSKPFVIFNATLIALSIIAFFSLYYQLQAKNTRFKHYIPPEELKIYLAYCYAVFVLASLSLATNLFFPKKTKDDSNLAIPILTTDTKEAEVSGKRNKGFITFLNNNFTLNLAAYGTLTISRFIAFILFALFFLAASTASYIDYFYNKDIISHRKPFRSLGIIVFGYFLVIIVVKDLIIYFLTKKDKYIIFIMPKFPKIDIPKDKIERRRFYFRFLKDAFLYIIGTLVLLYCFTSGLRTIIKHFAK